MRACVSDLKKAIQERLLETNPDRVFIATSGGLDSQALLHACLSLDVKTPLFTACFVDYGSAHSPEAYDVVNALCEKHGIPLLVHQVERDAPAGDSQEAYWRNRRYAWFASLLENTNDVLFTAHHQEDQAETFLLQLCRGAGLSGLSAMPQEQAFGEGRFCRPFLAISKDLLEAYVTEHHLPYVDDPSNDESRYARNFMRQNIMSALKKRWPSVASTISRSAEHCQEAQALLNELAALDTGVSGPIPFGTRLKVDGLLGLSAARQRLAIRHWMQAQGVRMPPLVQLDALLLQLTAGPDKHPRMLLGDCFIRRDREGWFLEKKT